MTKEEEALKTATKLAKEVYPKLWDAICRQAFIKGYLARMNFESSKDVII